MSTYLGNFTSVEIKTTAFLPENYVIYENFKKAYDRLETEQKTESFSVSYADSCIATDEIRLLDDLKGEFGEEVVFPDLSKILTIISMDDSLLLQNGKDNLFFVRRGEGHNTVFVYRTGDYIVLDMGVASGYKLPRGVRVFSALPV